MQTYLLKTARAKTGIIARLITRPEAYDGSRKYTKGQWFVLWTEARHYDRFVPREVIADMATVLDGFRGEKHGVHPVSVGFEIGHIREGNAPRVHPDPFIRAVITTPNGAEARIVFGVWDEPKWRNR